MNIPLSISTLVEGDLDSETDSHIGDSLVNLSKVWAERYIRTVSQPPPQPEIKTEADQRYAVSQTLAQRLRSVSAQAWNKTENLLSDEVIRHQIDPDSIDPWAIAGDVYEIYDLAFEGYAQGLVPERFAVNVAPKLGLIRAKFTAEDPRVIGFVSMQFHYTGQLLLELVDTAHQDVLGHYFKAIDDHLYMPLQRAYDAAASYPYGSNELNTIHRLLPQSSAIAKRVVTRVTQAFPAHQCYSGPLNSATVKLSSTRDAEMFQTYIWVCLLEKNISVVQQELFPLCVMLYPTFNVKWDIVRYMLTLLEREFAGLLKPEEFAPCSSYLDSLKMMFSPDVFTQAV